MPSLVARPLRFAADAWPLIRRTSIALATAPPASARAALQSIIPAPVRSRSAFTSAAETSPSLKGLPPAPFRWLATSRRLLHPAWRQRLLPPPPCGHAPRPRRAGALPPRDGGGSLPPPCGPPQPCAMTAPPRRRP